MFCIVNIANSQDFYVDDSVRFLPNVNISARKNIYETGLKVSRIDSLVYDENRQYSISELIAWKTPVFIKSYGRGSLATVSFRGTDPSHTKLTWNGLPLNSPLLGMADLSQIPLNIGDAMNLYHGTASLLSGYPAIGGRIAINSNPVWDGGLKLDLSSAFGSFHTFDEALNISYSTKTISIKTGAWYSYSRNDFEFINKDILDGGRQIRDDASWNRYGFIADTYFRIKNNSFLSAKLWWQAGQRSIPQLSTNEMGNLNNQNKQEDESLHALVSFNTFKGNSKLMLQSAISHQKNYYSLRNYINGTGYFDAINSKSIGLSNYNFADYKINFSEKFYASALMQFDLHSVKSDEFVSLNSFNVKRLELAGAISLFYKPIPSLSLSTSLREQLVDNSFSFPMPSFQLEYNFLKPLSFKANIARVLNYPSLNDIYYQPGGNPDLLPENSLMTEAGLQLFHKFKSFDFESEITGFYNNIENWILWKPSPRGYWSPENIDKVLTYGLEASIKFSTVFGKLKFDFNSAYTLSNSINKTKPSNPNDLSYNSQLPYIPKHSAMFYSTLYFRGFSFSYQWNYYSERLTATAVNSSPLLNIYPYFMNDVSLGKIFDFEKYAFNLRFSILNLFNEDYRSVLWQAMPGRNYMLTLRFMLK